MKHPLAVCLVTSTLCGCRDTEAARAEVIASSLDLPEDLAGLLLGSPLAITSNRGAGISMKLAGFTPGEPATWPPELTRPTFDTLVANMLDGTNIAVPAASPILAMSLGVDVIVVQTKTLEAGEWLDDASAVGMPVAVLDTPGHHGWYAIEFSVDGSLLAGADLAPDVAVAVARQEVDATVFSYVLPGSDLAMLPLEWETVRSLAPDDLGLTSRDQIHALNLHAGVYQTNLVLYPEVFAERAIPTQPWVYFTLRPEFLTGDVPERLRNGWGLADLPDSGTIYRTNWFNGRWTRPDLYRRWSDLGLSALAHAPIIDGLAIDGEETGDVRDDEILFSLAHTAGYGVPAEMQVQYVPWAGGPPRRVVVPLPPWPGRYGSLGKRMRAGRGIGDFCTGDPWNTAKISAKELQSDFLPDDFFIARRLETDEAHVLPARLRLPPAARTRADLQPGRLPEDSASRHRVHPSLVGGSHRVLVPGRESTVNVPELALAISGFRQHLDGRAKMRVCFSWPEPRAASGVATIWHGTADNVFAPVFVWDPVPITRSYAGAPMTLDLELGNDGLLLPPPAVSPGPNRTKARIVKWTLVANGQTFVSPVAALRY